MRPGEYCLGALHAAERNRNQNLERRRRRIRKEHGPPAGENKTQPTQGHASEEKETEMTMKKKTCSR
jgi:hypothetical protein